MQIIKAYFGKVNGVYMNVCNKVPEGMIVKQEKTFIKPDEGKCFLYDNKIIKGEVCVEDEEQISEYKEIDLPEEE